MNKTTSNPYEIQILSKGRDLPKAQPSTGKVPARFADRFATFEEYQEAMADFLNGMWQSGNRPWPLYRGRQRPYIGHIKRERNALPHQLQRLPLGLDSPPEPHHWHGSRPLVQWPSDGVPPHPRQPLGDHENALVLWRHL